jgi:hypothetical protein
LKEKKEWQEQHQLADADKIFKEKKRWGCVRNHHVAFT